MVNRTYHFIGSISGETPEDQRVLFIGMDWPAHVRTDLYACEDCGTAVAVGRGQAQHDRWHDDLARALESLAGRTGAPPWSRRSIGWPTTPG